ncbi:MAG: hypothetical protein QXG81_05400 [Ignisphaera sp.]
MVFRYILPLDLQFEWIRAVEAHKRREWVAGLKLVGGVIDWFGFVVGDEHSVRVVDLKGVENAVGTVHYHPYKHSVTPIPSMADGVNMVYSSYYEVSDELNPIFFIVFEDLYASWIMFPKPPIVRRLWLEEFSKLGMAKGKEEEASINLCLRLLEEGLIKTGIIQLGKKVYEFPTFS